MIDRLFDLPHIFKQKTDNPYIFFSKRKGEWTPVSVDDYIRKANEVSYALLANGIGKNDIVITLSDNRPEWNIADIGIMQIGAVHAPVNPKLKPEIIRNILLETEAKLAFVSNPLFFNLLKGMQEACPNLKTIVSFTPVSDALLFDHFLLEGKNASERFNLKEIKSGIKPDQLVKILYTSGSTGNPKGVCLTHDSFIADFEAGNKRLKIKQNYKALSFLPLFHVAEITMNYMYQSTGTSIYFADNFSSSISNFQEVKPNITITVVAILEKIYFDLIQYCRENNLYSEKELDFAIKTASHYQIGADFSDAYLQDLQKADETVFSKWRETVGGHLETLISGASIVPYHLEQLFRAAKIPVHVGYGLTETSMIISMTEKEDHCIGTTGKVLDSLELKFSNENEILVRGLPLMTGYFKNPEKTREVIDAEGWLHTGDIGELVDGRFLKITGRSKDIFKTRSGEYVSPELIEKKLNQSSLIAGSFVFPNGTAVNAIINLRPEKFVFTEDIAQLPATITNSEAINQIRTEIDNFYNNAAIETDQVKEFYLVVDEWTPENDCRTATLKLRRDTLRNRYKHLLPHS